MSDSTAIPELKTYTGNCHCGSFAFKVQLPELKSVMECNCSICTKKGYRWVFPSTEGAFTVEHDKGSLKDYEFGKKSMTHKVGLWPEDPQGGIVTDRDG